MDSSDAVFVEIYQSRSLTTPPYQYGVSRSHPELRKHTGQFVGHDHAVQASYRVNRVRMAHLTPLACGLVLLGQG